MPSRTPHQRVRECAGAEGRREAEEAEAGEETLMRRDAVVNDRPAVMSAVLALVMDGLHIAGRDRKRVPSFNGPPGIFGGRGVVIAGDFAANGPVEAGKGFGTHGGQIIGGPGERR
jgi:hypothetical protein